MTPQGVLPIQVLGHVPCSTLDTDIQEVNYLFTGLLIALGVLPILVGSFVGAPLLSKELESGTFRFSWTQGIGRVRYFLTTFAVLACIFVLIAVVLGLLFGNWYAHPFEVSGADSHWQAGLFETTWWLLATWSLFALACGCFIGAIIGRVVTAIAASTLAVRGAMLLAAFECFLFTTLVALIVTVCAKRCWGPIGTWIWVDSRRLVLTGPDNQVISGISETRVLDRALLTASRGSAGASRWLLSHGYKFWTSYQPRKRFWIFQCIEVSPY